MTGTFEGRIKSAARKLGIAPAQYHAKREAGCKWCTRCKDWHPVSAFKPDKSRRDGLAATCRDGRLELYEAKHVCIPRAHWKRQGPMPQPSRCGDKRQARSRINHAIEAGRLPHPNTLPCADCGHTMHEGCALRHEYDHHLGYESNSHLAVQAVCQACHLIREGRRRLCQCR